MKTLPCLLALALAPAGFCQEPDSAAVSDHQLILQLLNRIQDLETEVQRLKQPSPIATAATSTPPQASIPTQPDQAPIQETAGMGHYMIAPGLENMHFQGFSDIQYHASNAKGVTNSFALGQFNLFITNRLSDKFSILSEMVLEAGADNEVGVDLERLLFQYSANEYFKLSAGRYHTAIGYYNTAYHHATWLQTAVDRPFLFAFEDGGGILPIHNVGLSATGQLPSRGLGLHYIAEIGSGRRSRSPLEDPVQNRVDENNGKAVNLGLYIRPPKLTGFQTGFSLYRDTLHPNGLRKIGQTIYAAHVVYQMSGMEFLTEGLVIRHAIDQGRVYHIPSFYSQFSKRFGRLQPYFRYEYLNVAESDPMFADVGLRHGPTGGVRFNFTDFAAYKLEYFRDIRRNSGANGLRTQIAFTF